jgi:cereblon
VHDLVAFKRVAGAALSGRPETAHSWFPGYAWTIASCAVCGQHLGWEFTAAQAGLEPPRFWGLRRSCLAAVNEEEGISMALASDGA